MTTTDGPVTFLTIFEIPREDVEAFKDGWRERIALVDGAPGFRAARDARERSTWAALRCTLGGWPTAMLPAPEHSVG